MTDFKGRVVLVTGGANGMGEATAHVFAKNGATVVIADYDTERSPLVEAEIRAAGGDAHSIVTDVRDPSQVDSLVQQILGQWGRIDVVDNNSASLDLTPNDSDILNLDPDLFMETMRGNVLSMILVTKAVLPTMLAQGKGAIINMGSVSGVRGELMLSAYGMSKAAIIHFTKQVAVQYGRRGIRCNAIAPCYVLTRNNETYAPADMKDIYIRNTPIPELSPPDDIANTIFFLASDEAHSISGHIIPVDGGILEALPIVADFRDWSGFEAKLDETLKG